MKRSEFEIKAYKAIIRQYERKMKKMKTIAKAAITRHDEILDVANYNYEEGKFNEEIKSDSEDYDDDSK